MVLLSLGSGLITALMAQAKPSCPAADWAWFAEDNPMNDMRDGDNAVLPSDKTMSSQ